MNVATYLYSHSVRWGREKFYHNTVTLYSKKYCYVLMILHPKELSTFMSFLPDLKIGISSKIAEIFPCHTLDECSQKEQTLKIAFTVGKRVWSSLFWLTFAVSSILEQRAAFMSSVRSTLMGGEPFKILFVLFFFTYLKVDVEFPFCLWDITWRDN